MYIRFIGKDVVSKTNLRLAGIKRHYFSNHAIKYKRNKVSLLKTEVRVPKTESFEIATNEDVSSISKMLMEQNKVAYEVLAK